MKPSLPKSPAPTIDLEKTLASPETKRLRNGLRSEKRKQSADESASGSKLTKKQLSDARYEIHRRNTPLGRLGVSALVYATAPKISPILREIQGGKSKALKAMRFSAEPLCVAFLEKYDSISPRDRERLSIEAIALAAKLNILHLWGEIMLAMREHSVNSVKMIAVAEHPEVMKKTIEYAKTPGGNRDRQHVHEMLGALATPKGPTFINKFFAGGQQDDSEQKETPEELVEDVDFVFPDVSVMQEKVQPMRQKMLTGK